MFGGKLLEFIYAQTAKLTSMGNMQVTPGLSEIQRSGLSQYLNKMIVDTLFTAETYKGMAETISQRFAPSHRTATELEQAAGLSVTIQTGVGDPIAIGNEIIRLIKMNPNFKAGSLGSLA